MVENTVEKILAAEEEARAAYAAAEVKAMETREAAEKLREQQHKAALQKARAAGDAKRAAARLEADGICREARDEAEKTARVLSTMAARREDEAMAIVLDEMHKQR